MRPFDELRKTCNRSVYNKVYKWNLENKGKIKCSYCGYHCGENAENKWYGTIDDYKNQNFGHIIRIRKPSWKLVSKNRKQWMKKPIRKTHKKTYGKNNFSLDW